MSFGQDLLESRKENTLYPMAQVLFGLHKEGYLERYQKNKIHQRRISIYRLTETFLFAGVNSEGPDAGSAVMSQENMESQELMALNGQYAEMFRCQARYYQDSK